MFYLTEIVGGNWRSGRVWRWRYSYWLRVSAI